MSSSFGVIILCNKNDFIFAKGCCASVKYFMPDVPLCLLIDGDFDIGSFPDDYNPIILRKDNINDEFLKENSFGWGITRMIAFWESPFDSFLLLDADTNVWGDIRKLCDLNKYDVVIDKPLYKYDEESINKWFFNTSKINHYFPDFDYKNYDYVCPAVIFAKKYN